VHRKRQVGEGLGKAVAVQVAEVQNMARHVLKFRTNAEAFRAVLESAVQLRQLRARRRREQGSPTTCMDSLQLPKLAWLRVG
jgi:hypothetical protein